LIHRARQLVSQFNDCEGGCMYLPNEIGERPWPMAFLQHLAAGLRKMAGEFEVSEMKRRRRSMRKRNRQRIAGHARRMKR